MADLEFFTVVSNGIGAMQVDYVDAGVAPDEEVVYAFVDFVPREPAGTVHWLSGLTVPRGIQLDTVRGRFSTEDGKLRTIVGEPTDEQQLVTATGAFTLTYAGQTTASIPLASTPATVQAALEALSNIAVGDVYVSGVMQNERQTVSFTGSPTGGTFTVTFGGQTTGPISRNASASSVQAYLQALSSIGGDGVSVTGPTGGPWVVEFTGSLAGVNVAQMTTTSTGLTPSGTAVVATTQVGSTGNPFTVSFIGAFAAVNVAQMTATNAIVTTAVAGTADLGVQLVANTAVLDVEELIYDVVITVPDLDPLRVDRKVNPFGIVAPTTGGVTVDLANASLHVPPREA